MSSINDSEDSKMVYEMLYDKMVMPCVRLLEERKYRETMELYRDMTLKLEKRYVLT